MFLMMHEQQHVRRRRLFSSKLKSSKPLSIFRTGRRGRRRLKPWRKCRNMIFSIRAEKKVKAVEEALPGLVERAICEYQRSEDQFRDG
ncbi:hypothetical protein LIER_33775 [Lithospermum erythrorhizon]|uniref:Uncharacterized protein n=1 Tax=Lithospermum erythrorhizon TaxID=34254 RepID=A0AAV3RZ41_LITER